MKVIYLAHPLSGPTPEAMQENRLSAARWGVWIAKTFNVAVSADWIWWSTVLEETEENRALGLARDFVMVSRADEFWMVGGRVSKGMELEKAAAFKHGVLVRDLTELGREPPSSETLAIRLLRDAVDGVAAREVPNNNIGRDVEDDCG